MKHIIGKTNENQYLIKSGREYFGITLTKSLDGLTMDETIDKIINDENNVDEETSKINNERLKLSSKLINNGLLVLSVVAILIFSKMVFGSILELFKASFSPGEIVFFSWQCSLGVTTLIGQSIYFYKMKEDKDSFKFLADINKLRGYSYKQRKLKEKSKSIEESKTSVGLYEEKLGYEERKLFSSQLIPFISKKKFHEQVVKDDTDTFSNFIDKDNKTGDEFQPKETILKHTVNNQDVKLDSDLRRKSLEELKQLLSIYQSSEINQDVDITNDNNIKISTIIDFENLLESYKQNHVPITKEIINNLTEELADIVKSYRDCGLDFHKVYLKQQGSLEERFIEIEKVSQNIKMRLVELLLQRNSQNGDLSESSSDSKNGFKGHR